MSTTACRTPSGLASMAAIWAAGDFVSAAAPWAERSPARIPISKSAQLVIELLVQLNVELLVGLLYAAAQVGNFLLKLLASPHRSARPRGRPRFSACLPPRCGGCGRRSFGGAAGTGCADQDGSPRALFSESVFRGGGRPATRRAARQSRLSRLRDAVRAGAALAADPPAARIHRPALATDRPAGRLAGPAAHGRFHGLRWHIDLPPHSAACFFFASLIWLITQITRNTSPTRTLTTSFQPAAMRMGSVLVMMVFDSYLTGTGGWKTVDEVSNRTSLSSCHPCLTSCGPLAVAIAPRMFVSACTFCSL